MEEFLVYGIFCFLAVAAGVFLLVMESEVKILPSLVLSALWPLWLLGFVLGLGGELGLGVLAVAKDFAADNRFKRE